MGLMGLGGNANNLPAAGNGAGNTMNQNAVVAGKVQSTVVSILGLAYKQNCKFMIDEPGTGIRMGFSVEKLAHPYNTTIPVITRYPDVSQGFVDISSHTGSYTRMLERNISVITDPAEFMRAFEAIEQMMLAQGLYNIIQYGVRVSRIDAADGIRFSYELEPALAISFKNDLRF